MTQSNRSHFWKNDLAILSEKESVFLCAIYFLLEEKADSWGHF